MRTWRSVCDCVQNLENGGRGLAQANSDPFGKIDEVVAQYNAEQERKRRSSKSMAERDQVIGQLELTRSDDNTSDDSSSDDG